MNPVRGPSDDLAGIGFRDLRKWRRCLVHGAKLVYERRGISFTAFAIRIESDSVYPINREVG